VETFKSVCDHLRSGLPDSPVLCHRPHAATRSARWFLERFPGDVLYAIKANASPLILDALYGAGIRHFDVASLAEIQLVHHYGDVRLYCMNTAKHPAHIRRMYFEFGVRDFALDCQDELDKILAATNGARDLRLHVRIAVDNRASALPLSHKFGADAEEAGPLMLAARTHSEELGICFHVGSQSMNPLAYASAITRANNLIRKSGVLIDSLDVGGGFPSVYPGMQPRPLEEYIRVIEDAFEETLTSYTCRLLCEPGRALAAESASLLVAVTLRKGHWLYLNDGAYGSLFDAAHVDFKYPVRAVRNGRWLRGTYDTPFSFYGPTCDSIDAIKGPYHLPAGIRAGDYIEFGQMGAYGDGMRTDFNGFGRREQIIVTDEPMMSMFAGDQPRITRAATPAIERA